MILQKAIFEISPNFEFSCYRSRSRVPLSGIKESLLDRSATNANQGCFDSCASMIKKDENNSERCKISSKKQKIKQKTGQKYLP